MRVVLICVIWALQFTEGMAQRRELFLCQFGDTISPRNALYELERAYFELRIHVGDSDEVLIQLSPDSNNALLARNSLPTNQPWIRFGTGLSLDPNYRSNWLLVKSNDYMSWWPYSSFPTGNMYSVRGGEPGVHLNRMITSYAFYDQDGLDGTYSVFYVPLSRLYLSYTVAFPDLDGKSYTPVRTLPLRIMGN